MSGKDAVIGSLIVNVLAVTKKFREGLGYARKDLKDFSGDVSAMGRAATSLKGLLGAAFAGFTVRAAVEQFTTIADGLDSVAEAAKRVGIATGSLQALNFAGKMSGVESGTIERSLIKMSRSLSEVSQDSGAAKDALRELGVNANEIKSWGADRQLLKIAEGMRGVTDHADKLRIAVALFGKSGADMLPMLQGGAAEIRAFVAEAKTLGIVFDAKEVAKVEEMNDALDKLKATFGSLGQGFVIEAAPSLTSAARDLKDAAIGLKMRGVPSGPQPGMSRYMYGLDSMVSSMTRPFIAAKDWTSRYLKNSENWWVQRDLRNGIGAGGGDAAPNRKTILDNGAFYTFADDLPDEFIERRERSADMQRLLNIYRKRGFNALESGMTSVFGPRDPEERKKWKGNETLLELAKSIKSFQDSFRDNLKHYAWQAMLTRPGDAAFNARRREIHELREKSREFKMQEEDRKLDELRRKQAGGETRSANEALIAGTAEAFRAIAENKYPRLQLDEAKRMNRHLSAIERNLRFEEVGIG